jgi:hypothetical protein
MVYLEQFNRIKAIFVNTSNFTKWNQFLKIMDFTII